MVLTDLGATLRTERETNGLSIDDAADHLKIHVRLLRALEDGDLSALPHISYAKGFIRSYAAYLGMTNEDINALLTLLPEEPTPAVQTNTHLPSTSKRFYGRAVIVVLFLVALGECGYLAWQHGFFRSIFHRDLPKEELAENMQTPSLPPTPLELAPLPSEWAGNAQPTPQPRQPAVQQDTPAPVAENPPTETTPANEAQTHELVLIGTEECWIQSTADDTDVKRFFLNKSESFTIKFQKKVDLRLGNAGGVRFRYDGSELPPPGHSGQVKNISFPLHAQATER